jgi:acetylornithine deacetylase/succinyl-diaminopimelate desuccinylase family protein
MNEAIHDWLHAHRDEMFAFLEELVSIPSENPPGRRYPECTARIRAQLERFGMPCETIEVSAPNELPRIGLISGSNAERVLVFHGHYDVVPAQDPSQFTPRITNGTMFGRGTSDMKSGLVSMIYAKRALQELGSDVANEILLTMVPDEETGGRLGSGSLFADRLPHRDIAGMLMPEPTSGVVWNANRGAITLDVTITGRAAHVGLQHQGINAFEQMVHIVNRLLLLKSEIEQRRTAFRIVPDAARGSILLLGGTARAGMNFNVVPASAQFTIDRRINPEEDFDVERRVLHDILDAARAEGIELAVTTIQEGRPSATPEDGEIARALAASIAHVKGEAPAFEMCPGLLEIRFFAARGVPSFAYGPGVLAVSHGPQEFVKLDEVVNCAAIYAETALRVLRRSARY